MKFNAHSETKEWEGRRKGLHMLRERQEGLSEQMALKGGLKEERKGDWWMRIGKQFKFEVESAAADMNVTLMEKIWEKNRYKVIDLFSSKHSVCR